MNLKLDQVAKQIEVPGLQASMDFEVGFEIDPAIAYPAVINHIQDVLAGEDTVGIGFDNLMNSARSVTARGWNIALDSENLDRMAMSQLERQERAQALEVSRLWLTELLHQSVDQKSMYLHFLARVSWKL